MTRFTCINTTIFLISENMLIIRFHRRNTASGGHPASCASGEVMVSYGTQCKSSLPLKKKTRRSFSGLITAVCGRARCYSRELSLFHRTVLLCCYSLSCHNRRSAAICGFSVPALHLEKNSSSLKLNHFPSASESGINYAILFTFGNVKTAMRGNDNLRKISL